MLIEFVRICLFQAKPVLMPIALPSLDTMIGSILDSPRSVYSEVNMCVPSHDSHSQIRSPFYLRGKRMYLSHPSRISVTMLRTHLTGGGVERFDEICHQFQQDWTVKQTIVRCVTLRTCVQERGMWSA